jgi:signal peptidase I
MKQILLLSSLILMTACSDRSLYKMPNYHYMDPGISANETVHVDRVESASEALESLKRFSIVVVQDVPDLEGEIPFRVLGLPGETIEFTSLGVNINGEELFYPDGLSYLKTRLKKSKIRGTVFVPESFCFLIGDNLEIAQDSRFFGPLQIQKIVGFVK